MTCLTVQGGKIDYSPVARVGKGTADPDQGPTYNWVVSLSFSYAVRCLINIITAEDDKTIESSLTHNGLSLCATSKHHHEVVTVCRPAGLRGWRHRLGFVPAEHRGVSQTAQSARTDPSDTDQALHC